MYISEQQVISFQKLYKESLGINISLEDSKKEALSLLKFVDCISSNVLLKEEDYDKME